MLRPFVVGSLLSGLCAVALANGRSPNTSTINFQKGNESHIAAGMTFGVVLSKDNGLTWTWQCEDAVGYGGMYDPDYAFTATGALFATTFDGLKVNRDSCVYQASTLSPPSPAIKFFSTIAVGPDGAVYASAADPTDGKIYKSTDDGATFPTSAMPGEINDWWQNIEVAPSDAQVIYLTGYRLKSGMPRVHLLFRSSNGGQSFEPLPGSGTQQPNGIAVMPNSTIEIAGVSKTNANLVFARVTLSDNAISDAIYRSTDGGQSWTKVLEKQGSLAFVVRANGDLVAGTQVLGGFKSIDNGTTFTPLAGPPHINCLAENSAGEVWACTQNYGSPQVPTDDAGIMKSTDLATWTPVLKFQDLLAPEACPDGTIQKDRCDALLWCGLCAQLGCDAKRECAAAGDAGPQNDNTVVKEPPTGCCQSGDGGVPGLLALGAVIGMLVLRRRRS